MPASAASVSLRVILDLYYMSIVILETLDHGNTVFLVCVFCNQSSQLSYTDTEHAQYTTAWTAQASISNNKFKEVA